MKTNEAQRFEILVDRLDELRRDVVRICLGEIDLSEPAFDYVAFWTATHDGLIRNPSEGRKEIRREFAARVELGCMPIELIPELRRVGLLPRRRAAAA